MYNEFLLKWMISLVFLLSILPSAWAGISFEDDRRLMSDWNQASVSKLGTSVGTQISTKYLKSGETPSMSKYPSGEVRGLCPGEKFSGKKTLGECTGFLVGSNLLLTAGHCSKSFSEKNCGDAAWIFNQTQETTKDEWSFNTDEIYHCKRVVDAQKNGEADFAIIELRRHVKGAVPFKIDTKNQAKPQDPVAVLGYPLGLPLTVTFGGRIERKSRKDLLISSDALVQNSGSPVLNLRTGFVEGILTNSKSALKVSSLDGCRTIESSDEAQTSLVRTINGLDYFKEKYSFDLGENIFEITNKCDSPTKAIVKFRDLKNKWRTQVVDMKSQSQIFVDAKVDEIFVYAENRKNKYFLKGKDFYGFSDSGRMEEYGFKKVTSKEVNLCDD